MIKKVQHLQYFLVQQFSGVLETISSITSLVVFFDIMSVFVKPGAMSVDSNIIKTSSLDNTLACDIKTAFVDTLILPSLPSIAELDEILTILPRFI